MPKRPRKAVLPVAGLGTRFLPATKAVPKEMLTVVDKPALQYVVEEAFEAGFEHVVCVTGRNKHVIEDHFDMAYELEATLEAKSRTALLERLHAERPKAGAISFTRQQEPLGLGHAVWCARDLVGEEPFAVMLPDMLIKAPKGCLAQMMEAYEDGANLVAVQPVAWERVSAYGVVDVAEGPERSKPMRAMVEKPKREDAPSNLFIVGRYVLQPEIFGLLENQGAGAGGEIQLTDAMARLMKDQPFRAFTFDGEVYDCGDKLGWLTANLAYARDHAELGPQAREAIARFAD